MWRLHMSKHLMSASWLWTQQLTCLTYWPGIVRVTRPEAVCTDLDRVGPYKIWVIRSIPLVRVCTHDGFVFVQRCGKQHLCLFCLFYCMTKVLDFWYHPLYWKSLSAYRGCSSYRNVFIHKVQVQTVWALQQSIIPRLNLANIFQSWLRQQDVHREIKASDRPEYCLGKIA